MNDVAAIRVIDTETTGMEPDDRIVEIGWTDLDVLGEGTILLGPTEFRIINPHRPIPPQAMAIHHITDREAAAGYELADILPQITRGAPIYAAHNAKFDRQYLDLPGDWICTYKCALTVWPDAPSHGNQVLRYWLGLDIPPAKAEPAHRAGPDTYVTAKILMKLLDHRAVDQLIEITSQPALLSKFRFGKHEGVPLADVPSDYLAWMLRQDFEEDVMHTARYHLDRRSGQ